MLLLFYPSPVWAALLGRLVLRESLNRQTGLTLGIGLLGTVLMLWDPAAGMLTGLAWRTGWRCRRA